MERLLGKEPTMSRKIKKIPLGLGVTMRIYNAIKEFQGNIKANLKDLSNKIFIKIELILFNHCEYYNNNI